MAGAGRSRDGPLVARAAELAWISDHELEVASDLSVFHRIDDPMAMDCARYFQLAELLPAYDGAVRLAGMRDLQEARGEQNFQDGLSTLVGAGDPGADQPPAVTYDDGLTVTHDGALPFVPNGVRGQFTGATPGAVDDVAALAALSRQAGPGFPTIQYQGG